MALPPFLRRRIGGWPEIALVIDQFGFLIAVCATSAVCYALVTRADRISDRLVARRRSGGDNSDTGSDNWTLTSWFSGGHSAAYDSSGNPVDFGSCDSSGDSGGSADSGGGGGD